MKKSKLKSENKMSVLLRNVTNSICHAFNGLPQDQEGSVNKTKLKVLTANIATVLDLYGLEKGLDHFKSTASLNFKNFHEYLGKEVFGSLPSSLTMKELRNYEEKIDEICWLICRSKFTLKKRRSLLDTQIYKLFRIFCLLSDLNVINMDDENSICEVLMHSSEVYIVLQQVLSALGLDTEILDDKKMQRLNETGAFFNFDEFLELIDTKYDHRDLIEYNESLFEIIEDIYQTYIRDIIKKGYLLRKGYLLPTFKEYWFILQPYEISYYKNHYEKELCGTITLDPKCLVKPCTSNSSKIEKVLKFILSSGDHNFELATHDHRTRMQWIAALQLAITYSTGREGFQRDLVTKRRSKRETEMKKRKEEELLRSNHVQEVQKAKIQLEKEKTARLAAEALAREDSRRVAELEDMKQTLEKLLEEEIQAKRDEEIVRALQARVLAEEWEKREELERLQQEQKVLLEQERSKRIEFEEMQKKKENELRTAENRLRKLEEERKKLDLELKQARYKIMRSEENKEDLEARMDAMFPILNGLNKNGGIRRTHSFVDTLIDSRERPTKLEEIRAATLRSRKIKHSS
ncbi:differentially expressed in FDCP 6 homolog [Condylostylus longicornis]|uniref:differentially expressed in FDCP 6 homolog n=1 Tax=Condylostylus longicornis TaxID=2530218 RepID=UPI00244E2FA0|nr:differentially expressed in FDCP 6 homolog [Condylostylus longicornis]